MLGYEREKSRRYYDLGFCCRVCFIVIGDFFGRVGREIVGIVVREVDSV